MLFKQILFTAISIIISTTVSYFIILKSIKQIGKVGPKGPPGDRVQSVQMVIEDLREHLEAQE